MTIRSAVRAALLLGAFAAPAALAAGEAGNVEFAKGVATVQTQGAAPRFVGAGSPLSQGDVLTVGRDSYAIVKLGDGSLVTLRPNTVFGIEKLNAAQGEESALLRLFKGGLRAVTGFISKRNPSGYAIATSTATIGIRGTDFDARLCEGRECADEEAKARPTAAAPPAPVAARVVQIKGPLTATGPDARPRALLEGAPVYEGDVLETAAGAHAVLAFRDQGKVTLQSGSRLAVRKFRQGGEDEGVVLGLLRGGLRAVTGLIGKLDRRAYRVETPTATVGIRGTGFDVNCGGGSSKEQADACQPMHVYTWDGETVMNPDGEALPVPAGQAAVVEGPGKPPTLLPAVPPFMQENPAPRPDGVPADTQKLFGVGEVPAGEPGLYVSVREGQVTIAFADGKLDLGSGESGYLNPGGTQATRLPAVPAFQSSDPYPRPDQVDPKNTGLLNLFGPGESGGLQCIVR